jgi:hypothetical protein
VEVPRAAVLLTLMVSVLVDVVAEGLKLAVTPAGSPAMERLTLPLNPFTGVTVMVLLPLADLLMLRLVGEAESEKSGTTGALTVSVMVVVRVNVPDVPLMVSVTVPVAAALPALSVKVLAEVALVGLKLAVTPEGRPEIDRLTVPLKPLIGFTLMVLVPMVPCVNVSEAGEADKLKSGVVVFHTSVIGETFALWPAWVRP